VKGRAAVVAMALALAGCTYHPILPKDHKVTLLYVALGDSTVEGVGATSAAATYPARLFTRLRAIYPRAGVINLGVGGATSADVVSHQLERAVVMRPKLVTLSVGPNDITDHVPVAEYEANVGTIFRRFADEIGTVVVVNLLPDLAVTPRFRGSANEREVARLTVEFNAALTRQARLYAVEVVDLYKPSQVEVPRRPELLAADGYHPSDLGYARWAELLWVGVEKRIGGRRAATPNTTPVVAVEGARES
jgi:lysophospholipase L1-like esterase